MKITKKNLVRSTLALLLAAFAAAAAAELPVLGAAVVAADQAASQHDGSYREGRRALDDERWNDAVRHFSAAAAEGGEDADAALYWQAYAHHKVGEKAAALEVLAHFRGTYPESRWRDDARALEMEIGRGSGRAPAPAAEDEDDELKLLALNSLMHMDSERAVEMLEKFLAADRSPKLRERALFVLSQSPSRRARALLLEAARGERGEELQLEALKFLGMTGEPVPDELMEIYRKSSDAEVKKTVLHAFMMSQDASKLLQVARSESDPELQRAAVQGLGMTGSEEAMAYLGELYASAADAEVKKAVLHAFMISDDASKLIEIARGEADPELQRTVVQVLGMTGSDEAMAYLGELYASATDVEVKRAVLHAFMISGDASKLIEIARGETDPELRKAAIRQISMIGSEEAVEFMVEILEE